MKRLGSLYKTGMWLLIGALSATTLGVTAWGIFSRNVLNRSVVWADTVATWLFVWIVFLGSAVAVTRNAHMEIGVGKESLPAPAAKVVTIVCHLAVIAAGIFLADAGYEFVQVSGDNPAPALGATLKWVLWAFPVGSVLIVLHAIERLVHTIRTPAEQLRRQALEEKENAAMDEVV